MRFQKRCNDLQRRRIGMNEFWIEMIDFPNDQCNISLILIIAGNIQILVYAVVFISSVICKGQASYHQHPAVRKVSKLLPVPVEMCFFLWTRNALFNVELHGCSTASASIGF